MTFYDIQAEQEVIGNLLNDSDSLLDVMGFLTVEDFYNPHFAKAFSCISDAYNAGEQIDLVTLAERTRIKGDILASCVDTGWLSANIKSKANRIIDMAHKRRTYNGCRKLMAEVKDLTPSEMSSRLSDLAAEISLKGSTKKVYSAQELTKRVTSLQEERLKEPDHVRGIKIGFTVLDNQLRGLRPKRMTVVAAATGFGKSTLALNLFSNVVQFGHRALFLSNENDVDDNLDRLCGITTGLDVKEVENGRAYKKVCTGFAGAFWQKSMFISDNSPRTIDEVIGTISKYAIKERIELAVVDYIGEISGEGKDKENEEQKLARYAQRLVDCSKTLGIHLIVLAQLNREGNKRGRPSKAELAGCFRLAQKAHSMLLFWQEENKQDIITVEKNRQGPAGIDIAVDFNRNTQTIKEQGIWLTSSKEIHKPRV